MLKKQLCFFLILQLCSVIQLKAQSKSAEGLKDYYKNYFPIGVAVSAHDIKDTAEVKLILHEFNSLTPENAMKMAPIHPEENRYYWKDADGKLVTKDVLLKRLKDHITTVVNRYKGKIYAWDVVNEAIDDDSTKFLRNSLWYQICGEDFIAKAFEYAHEADPKAILFYNDYNTERPEKRERVYRLLKKLVDAGVPINAVGIQAHWSLDEPSQQDLIATIKKFSSLGLKVQVTELDISIYPWEKNKRTLRPGETDAYTPELEKKQDEKYAEVFKVFRDYKNVISGVTFWNISDKRTWLDDYPVEGRKNYPLLFDQQLQRKKAYWSVVDFKQ